LKDPHLKEWLLYSKTAGIKILVTVNAVRSPLEMQTSQCYCDTKILTDTKVQKIIFSLAHFVSC